MNKLIIQFLTLLILCSCLCSCVLKKETYLNVIDEGTYSGTVTHYDGINAACPKIKIDITLKNNKVNLSVTPEGTILETQSATTSLTEKNQFYSEFFQTNLSGITPLISGLFICNTTALGDTSQIDNIRIKTADDLGHKAEIGEDIARGSLFTEFQCADGSIEQFCVYYFQFNKK